MNTRTLGWIAAPLLALAISAEAQHWPPAYVSELDTPVKAGSSIKLKNLVDKVFKGIRRDPASDHWLTSSEKTLRRIGEKDRVVVPADTPLTSFYKLDVRGDGKRYVVLFIEAEGDFNDVPGGGAAVLAVFPENSTEPQDVAEVKGDMFCSPDNPPTIAVGPDDLFFVSSSHSNSSQSYLLTDVFQIHGGRLRKVDEIFTLNSRDACELSDEELSWRTAPDPDSPYLKLEAKVVLTFSVAEGDDSDCPKKPRPKQVFTQTYRFDKAKDRYVPSGGNMDRLTKFNEKGL